MSDVQPAPNPASPLAGPAPQPYLDGATAQSLLQSRYPRFQLSTTPGPGDMLVASMALDEEGPFLGVKVEPEQDRSWPRTFEYGWPNVVSAPSPLLVARDFPGAWLLDYEKVVPQQVLDWVSLEVFRMYELDGTRVVTAESVSGASVKYAPPVDYKGGQMSQLDVIQQSLLAPFQVREGRVVPFIFWSGG